VNGQYICDICGKRLKSKGGLKAHKRLVHSDVEGQQALLSQNSNKEVTMENTDTFGKLSKLFEQGKRGLLSPPETEEEHKKAPLDSLRLSTIQTMQVIIEVAQVTHPEKMQEVLDEFKDEPDFRRVVMLDWLDQTYSSLGKVHSLSELMVKVLKKEAVEAGILTEGEELPEAPRTKLEPVLVELANRLAPRR